MKKMRTHFALTVIFMFFSTVAITAFASDLSQAGARGSQEYKAAVENFLNPIKEKIIDGKEAAPDQFPWQVSLDVSWIADPFKGHFCGGAIINESWILTAAHCVDGNEAVDIIVSAGQTDLAKPGDRVNVKDIYIRKGYTNSKSGMDIALLKLQRPLKKLENIKLITPLKDFEKINESSVFTVSGWGATNEGGSQSRKLLFIEKIPYIPSSLCNRSSIYDNEIKDDMICAGFLAGGKDSCQGDSGGPKVFYLNSVPTLSGIVSWGEGCARPNKPGVYTKVSKYIGWIEACLNSPTCEHR